MTDPAEHEHLGAAEPHDDHPGEEEGRRYPSTIGGAFYLLVLAVVASAAPVAEPQPVGLFLPSHAHGDA